MSFRRAVRIHLYSRWKQLGQSEHIKRYLAANAARKINVGCGANILTGWFNADLYPRFGASFMDAGKPWPFADGAFEALLCEHMIEHVPKDLGRRLIAEAFRTLAPGGKARIVTPDVTSFSRMILFPAERPKGEAYLDVIREVFGPAEPSWCDAINYCFYEHGHRYIYSPEELRAELEAAGFRDIVETRAGEPSDALFEGVEGHVRVIGAAPDAFEAFGLEAVKPLVS